MAWLVMSRKDKLSGVVRSPALRDHIAAAILDKAAGILAERREAASLAEIAEAAGVARSTLYRYFPNRDALLQALADTAQDEIQERIDEAQLEVLPVPEAIARLTRGLIAAGSKYIALAYLWHKPADSARLASESLLALFRRGVADGTLRRDLPAEALLGSYADLIEGAITRSASNRAGVEETSAGVLTIFLNGALSNPLPARPTVVS
jgi:TetR/AcrR family transcriptional regulator, mexCD-oprJ operon repressor